MWPDRLRSREAWRAWRFRLASWPSTSRNHIFQPRQVGFGGAQAQLGLVTALMQSADAGGFFQDGAARQQLCEISRPIWP